MEIAKTFDRNGVRYRPGDPLPEGLDQITLDHYKRHGMVREAKPQETKPEGPKRRTSTPRPKETKPAGPSENSQFTAQAELSAGEGQASDDGLSTAESTVHTSAQDAGESPDADASTEADPVQPEA